MSATILQLPLFKDRPVRRALTPQVHAVSLPARTFTGDFYFTHRYKDRLWFALGDVAGKGINAAVVMAMIQEELEHRITACAVTRCDPAATMFRLHTFLRPLLPDNRFATTVIGHLREDGVLAIANGGHCPVLIARKDGTIEEITSTGPVVGMLPAPQWCSAVVQLERGDTVLLYSDGLLEAHCGEGDDFGLARIKQALAEASRLPTARETAAAIVDVAESYAGEGLRGDDLTLVVVRM